MAIKVHMKRKVAKQSAGELKELIDRLRSVTTGQPGYISGETLRRIDMPGEFLVISKWKSTQSWEMWRENPQRIEIQEKIDALLETPTEYEIWDYE